MEKIKRSVSALQLNSTILPNISTEDLACDGLVHMVPRAYQLSGVNWLLSAHARTGQSGCMLGDEMGLGKTLQTVAYLLHIKAQGLTAGPSLIVSPLTVLDNWRQEISKCAPSLRIVVYIGDKSAREEIKQGVADKISGDNWMNASVPFDVLLTTYEMCLNDSSFLRKFEWASLVVDEAHRLKNHKSLLHQELLEFNFRFKILLTGTPVQNNLEEIYSLLSFINPKIFKIDYLTEFTSHFRTVTSNDLSASASSNADLHTILAPFLLRRTKNEVLRDLPRKSEVLIYCGLSDTQKRLYREILRKELVVYTAQGTLKQSRLNNVLMQLRKCCGHPYAFPGVEAEPFELGDHLIDASGKLRLLDAILSHLMQTKHKVLLFSQFTTMLDIIQDYLSYRGYIYERLDGSVRGEERFLAVNNFNASDETFVFLLSTRAGGQGLNLVSADTVIFFDNDFNPQNDLQAAARAHRIGQTRPVKVIRLVTRNTVEEIILRRANIKLQLTNVVIEGGKFSDAKQQLTHNSDELADILKFGLDDLLKLDEGSTKDINFDSLLGDSVNGVWTETIGDNSNQEDNMLLDKDTDSVLEKDSNIHEFEGCDYSKNSSSKEDKTAFDQMLADVTSETITENERPTRKNKELVLFSPLDESSGKRKRAVLTDEEKLERKKKRDESTRKKQKLSDERKQEKMLKLWDLSGYISMEIEVDDDSAASSDAGSDDDEYADDDEENNDKDDGRQIEYVMGDVTEPQSLQKGVESIVVHCVDDSGYWGKGGLFTAIHNRSPAVKEQYEFAATMKDISLGDVHLVKLYPDDTQNYTHVALIIAHIRSKQGHLSPLLLTHLRTGLEKIHCVAKRTGASVHFPRIGYNTPNFNWYGTEKLIKKLLCSKGVSTYIYYFNRHLQKSRQYPVVTPTIQSSTTTTKAIDELDCNSNDSSSSTENININIKCTSLPLREASREDSEIVSSSVDSDTIDALPDFFSNVSIFFLGVDAEVQRRLSRFVIAYDGEVEQNFSQRVTHVVFGVLTGDDSAMAVFQSAKVVSVDWLKMCVSEGSCVDESLYLFCSV